MGSINCFEDLEVWQLARFFAAEMYKITSNQFFVRDFRFRDQLRASSGSIMDNIAEGFERDGNKEFIQFLYIAKGSCGESRSQLYRALDVNYIDKTTFDCYFNKAQTISKLLSNFISYLKQSGLKGNKYK